MGECFNKFNINKYVLRHCKAEDVQSSVVFSYQFRYLNCYHVVQCFQTLQSSRTFSVCNTCASVISLLANTHHHSKFRVRCINMAKSYRETMPPLW